MTGVFGELISFADEMVNRVCRIDTIEVRNHPTITDEGIWQGAEEIFLNVIIPLNAGFFNDPVVIIAGKMYYTNSCGGSFLGTRHFKCQYLVTEEVENETKAKNSLCGDKV